MSINKLKSTNELLEKIQASEEIIQYQDSEMATFDFLGNAPVLLFSGFSITLGHASVHLTTHIFTDRRALYLKLDPNTGYPYSFFLLIFLSLSRQRTRYYYKSGHDRFLSRHLYFVID
jgi:hypothetical protein